MSSSNLEIIGRKRRNSTEPKKNWRCSVLDQGKNLNDQKYKIFMAENNVDKEKIFVYKEVNPKKQKTVEIIQDINTEKIPEYIGNKIQENIQKIQNDPLQIQYDIQEDIRQFFYKGNPNEKPVEETPEPPKILENIKRRKSTSSSKTTESEYYPDDYFVKEEKEENMNEILNWIEDLSEGIVEII